MNLSNIINSKNYQTGMLFVVFTYALMFVPFVSIAKICSVFLILGSLPLFFVYRSRIFKDPSMLILGVVILCQLFSWANSLLHIPQLAFSTPRIDRLSKLFIFIFIAYWLRGSLRNAYVLWGLFIVGFIIGCFVHADFFQQLQLGLSGTRVDFGIKNAQFTTMFGGVGIMLSLFLISRVWLNKAFQYRPLVLCFLLFVFIVCTVITIISQSRMVWLALSIVALVTPLIVYKLNPNKCNYKGIFWGYVIIAITAVMFSQIHIFETRTVGTEVGTFHYLLHGDFKNIPLTGSSSIGIRIHSWLEAAKWIHQHPFLGLDANAIPAVIHNASTFPAEIRRNIGHLHSFHVEMLVAYGLFGLISIYALYFWLLKSLWLMVKNQERNCHLSKKQPLRALFIFSLLFVLYWFIINCFETFNSRSYGVFTHNIMAASIYTFYFYHAMTKTDESSLEVQSLHN